MYSKSSIVLCCLGSYVVVHVYVGVFVGCVLTSWLILHVCLAQFDKGSGLLHHIFP